MGLFLTSHTIKRFPNEPFLLPSHIDLWLSGVILRMPPFFFCAH